MVTSPWMKESGVHRNEENIMEHVVKVRHYLNRIADAIVENDMIELHVITNEAVEDYISDNITYKELYVIKAMTAIGTVASIK